LAPLTVCKSVNCVPNSVSAAPLLTESWGLYHLASISLSSSSQHGKPRKAPFTLRNRSCYSKMSNNPFPEKPSKSQTPKYQTGQHPPPCLRTSRQARLKSRHNPAHHIIPIAQLFPIKLSLPIAIHASFLANPQAFLTREEQERRDAQASGWLDVWKLGDAVGSPG
jgi:hypothetical protein